MMNIKIRKEKENDYKLSEIVVERAFENAEHTDHREHFLVAKLRKSNVFVPELSLVAELDDKIIGHIMLTKLQIENEKNKYESLALALESKALEGITGTVIYSKEFLE